MSGKKDLTNQELYALAAATELVGLPAKASFYSVVCGMDPVDALRLERRQFKLTTRDLASIRMCMHRKTAARAVVAEQDQPEAASFQKRLAAAQEGLQ